MKFEQRETQKQDKLDISRIKKIKVVKPGFKPESETRPHSHFWMKVGALAFSAFLAAAPLAAKHKRAHESAPVEKPAAVQVDADAGPPQEASPQPPAETNEADAGVGQPISAANGQTEDDFFSKMYSNGEIFGFDAGAAPEEQPKTDEGHIFSHNLIFPALPKRVSQYTDPSLSQFSDTVKINGQPREINLENNFDIGANLVGNEAGNAVFGSARYRDLARLDTGMIAWFGNQMVPFGRVGVSPYMNIWRFKLGYYGSAAFLGNMPSYVYSSHSVGVGYSQPIGENFKLRMGGVIGGALSYPVWDDTYFNLSVGLSMEIYKMFLLYGVPSFYFAADDPIKTAYAGYYRPKFQDVEVGAQVALKEYTIRAFADIGLIGDDYGIYNKYGVRGTRTFSVKDNVEVDLWVSLGATQWSEQLSGRFDPLIMAGATLVIGGQYVNSTNTVNYSHAQDMTWEQAKTDKPDSAHPGPYAFGHSGDPYYDVPINETKARILNSGSFDQFKNSYGNSLSQDEVIVRARFLGAFLERVAYANGAYDAMTNGNIFDSEVKRIAGADDELIFQYMKSYVNWYSTHSSKDPLPDNLKNGIAVCAGIHWLMAEFMRANGVDAVVRQVSTPEGMHVIAIAKLKDRAVLVDYGDTLEASDVDHAMQLYGQMNGAPTFESQTFGKKGYMGTEVTPAGRLLHGVVGWDNADIVKEDYLGVK